MKCQATPPLSTCTGTYTEDACPTCAGAEGEDRCMNLVPRQGRPYGNKDPVTNCIGPFATTAGWRCSDCSPLKRQGQTVATWKALAANREKKAKWLATLPSIGRGSLKTVYDRGDWGSLTPAAIDHNYNAAGGLDWCPWIKIGNLYVTVTTGNDAGWRLLVERHLEPDPANPRVINVFTGRHGNPEGTITDDAYELFSDKVMDANHYLQDIIQKAVADGRYAAQDQALRPRIKLWDVGTTQGSTMTKTLQLASERLKKGEVVIFAWCWSLLSFYKVTVQEAKDYSRFDLTQAYNLPIKQIVASKYGWAAFTTPGKGKVHRLAEAIEAADAAAFKSSAWRTKTSLHGRKTDEVLRTQYQGGISESVAASSKGSLSDALKVELNKISPVHYR